ncbi:MAG: SMI1/KNR4 family protein [Cytophagales bacterium]|nr:SMI1/KNR4 family protein [Armatimonadota bacterium]
MPARIYRDLVLPPGDAPQGTTTGEAALTAVRLPNGFRLPPSYRDFVRTLGYGLLCHFFIIYVPIPGHCEDLETQSARLAAFFRQGVEEEWFEYEPDGDPEQVRRLVPFGISENGDFLAWDPEEATGPNECAVYLIGYKFGGVRRAASDLYDLVARCLDRRLETTIGEAVSLLDDTFRPCAITVPGDPRVE